MTHRRRQIVERVKTLLENVDNSVVHNEQYYDVIAEDTLNVYVNALEEASIPLYDTNIAPVWSRIASIVIEAQQRQTDVLDDALGDEIAVKIETALAENLSLIDAADTERLLNTNMVLVGTNISYEGGDDRNVKVTLTYEAPYVTQANEVE